MSDLLVSEEEQQAILENKTHECLVSQIAHPSVLHCPQVWDKILCWPPTAAGEISQQPCPTYILGFNPMNNASKKCESDGTWYKNQTSNQTWTNYTLCSTNQFTQIFIKIPQSQNVSIFISEYIGAVKTVSQIGYAISLVTLLVAFCILASFKKLRCPRNMLHMHLFISFMMRSFFSLLKSALFLSGVALSSDVIRTRGGHTYLSDDIQKTWACKIILIGWQYFQLANYAWLFMEGLYLHNLIFLALFSDTSSICIYTLFGWGLPAVFVAIWAITRILHENELCWTTNNNLLIYSIIRIPIIISILLNFCMFINIIRVLMVKLRASMSEETKRLRRWAKSTLVLVPLFGVQYVVFLAVSAVQADDGRVQVIWLFFDQLLGSFQGCMVAILYCFMNSEVQGELLRLKKKLICCRGKRRIDRGSVDMEEMQEINVASVKSNETGKTYLPISTADVRNATGTGSLKGSKLLRDNVETDETRKSRENDSQQKMSLLSQEVSNTGHQRFQRGNSYHGADSQYA